MATILHRFPLSHFSEKGRALLDFKSLDYQIREYTLGLPQRRIVKLSGQRKVPVLEHDGRIVSDSTRIAEYLDEAFPTRRRLIPEDGPRRGEVLALEDRIDHVLGIGGPLAWAGYALDHREHLDALALEIHGASVPLVRAIGAGARGLRTKTKKLVRELAERLDRSKFLVGDEPTLADVAAAGLAFHLEFPRSKHLVVPELVGRGVPDYVDDPELSPFFAWRRRFYADFLA
jgi:glutathione S-transferase